MSDILEAAQEFGEALHSVGAMDKVTLRMLNEICLPEKRKFSPGEIKAIREKTHLSQPVFAHFLNVARNTVAQWEQGKKKPSGPSVRLLDMIDRKGIDVLA